MKLSLSMQPGGKVFGVPMDRVLLADSLGYDAVWSAETYSTDAMTPLAYVAALTKRIKLGTSIAQVDARTPANLAMCAQTIDAMAGGGRFILGLGMSGPQIVEGWLGRPWGKPNQRMRDTVAIVRKIWGREYVEHDGEEIKLPYRGPGSSGLGKPLKSILQAPEPPIPIYIGAGAPASVRMAGEIADGLMIFHPSVASVKDSIALVGQGLAKRTDGMTLDRFEFRVSLPVRLDDDVKGAIQALKADVAFRVGGMGAKSANFHKDAMVRRGYADAAERVQELFLAGRREEAAAAIPDEYVDDEALIGPEARIAERYRAWRDSGVTSLAIRLAPVEIIRMMARIVLGAKVGA
jgi:F420-dependent oxidoreductase-like protein